MSTTHRSPVADRSRHIAIIGAGHMGGAFATGLAQSEFTNRIDLIDPRFEHDPSSRFANPKIRCYASRDGIQDFAPDVCILAVKPQIMSRVAPTYADLAKQALTISIAAGTKLDSLSQWLNGSQNIVRAMPNLPASLHQGMTGAFAKFAPTSDQRTHAELILRAVGDVVWVDNEDLINVVTAISGSGPAYIFLFAEALTAAAKAAGFNDETAAALARRTIEGAGALLRSSELSAQELRASVTSPGGTTEAALRVFMQEQAMHRLVQQAVTAATERGRELSKSD